MIFIVPLRTKEYRRNNFPTSLFCSPNGALEMEPVSSTPMGLAGNGSSGPGVSPQAIFGRPVGAANRKVIYGPFLNPYALRAKFRPLAVDARRASGLAAPLSIT